MAAKKTKLDEHFSLLTDVCLQNLPLDVRIIGDRSTEVYRSRFLASAMDTGKNILIIEAPTSKGNTVILRAGQEIKVIFVSQGIVHSFNTTIIGRERHKLNPEVAVPSLKIEAPSSISVGKLRSFYRLSVPEKAPIELSLGIYARQKGKSNRIRAREKAIMTDIGGGGLGFRIPEGRSLLLNIDTQLSLSFHLPNDEQQVRLIGRVCFYLKRKDLREIFFGIQFVDVDSSVEYKKSIDRILRYVAEQQRANLQKRLVRFDEK